jgi:hypothetical protein
MCKTNLYIGASRDQRLTLWRVGPAMLVALALTTIGCDAPTGATTADAGASPNASILPAPLVAEPSDLFEAGAPQDEGARAAPGDSAGRPPESFHPFAPLAADPTPYARDASGVTLEAAFRWRDVPAPPRAPEVSSDAHRDAQKLMTLSMRIDLTELGRMRAELTGSAFLLPVHSELRARSDHYGTVLVWPNAGGYRLIPPGALRTLLGERRVDVTPLAAGAPRPQGDGRRLGLAVRKVEVSSYVATLRLELGHVPESGEGGALLCRALVELASVDPRTSICQPGETSLLASYAWQEGGGITFEVVSVMKRTDLAASALLVPPPGLEAVTSGLPAVPHGIFRIFLSREALAALRTAPIVLPAAHDPQVPGEGFVAANHSDRTMMMLLDGIPALWVAPFAEQYVIGPVRGRYGVQWRTFLGEKVGAQQIVEVPARLVFGNAPDGGAPDGG